MKMFCSLMVFVAAAAVSACESRGRVESPGALPSNGPPAASCDAEKVKWTIGERPSTELLERARREAAADRARFLRPDEMITMEFVASRLNLELDASGRIKSARCG